MTKVLVDENLLEKVLIAHALVLENLRVWNNEDNLKRLLWIQYAKTAMLHDISKLRSTIQSPEATSEKVDAQNLMRQTSERAPVFQYLDGQVAKDMKGFYDAFGIKQPPERN